jgi:dTDP-4-dehydrorhamnose reductase
MKILLLGANGQVGWECQRSLSIFASLAVHDRKTADFLDLSALRQLVRTVQPDVIVNAAAYTAVDQAEVDSETAYKINTEAVSVLASEAKALGACLVHYSTDYVFDGDKDGRYHEDDTTNPQSVYGKSKLDGELAIVESGCHYFIFRTSWVFASRGNNFAKTMIKLATERDELRVVADQVGAPTSAELIADVTARVVDRLRQQSSFAGQHSGIYNLVASGDTSWHGFAQRVLEKASALGLDLRVTPREIAAISTAEFPRPAVRPSNSRMDTYKLQTLLNIDMPDWQFHVDRMVTEFIESQS